MPVSEIQVLSLEDTTTWITNWWGLVSCAFFASRHRNCNLRIQKRSALYKWSGAQIQSFLKPLRLILSFFKKEKEWKDEKTWNVCNKNKIKYIYIYTGNNKNDRKVIASSSSVPVFCLALHATSTFCAVRWGTRHSMCQKSGPTAALAETGAMLLIGLWVSSHIGHIWHDAKDLSFSASVKGIPIRKIFLLGGGGGASFDFTVSLLLHFENYFYDLYYVWTEARHQRACIMVKRTKSAKMVLTKQNQNAGLFVQVYWCIYVQVLFIVHVWDACSMSASRFFRYFSPRSATFFFDESPRKICFQGTILFLIASFVGLVLCDVLLHATTSSLEFSQITLKQLKQAISSNTKKMPQNPGWLEVLTVREMTITCKAIGLGASRKFFGICKVPTGYSDFEISTDFKINTQSWPHLAPTLEEAGLAAAL